MHGEERQDGALRCVLRGERADRAEPGLLHAADSRGGSDPYETGFTTGQRNIFRQAFQKRADASLVKVTNFTERYALKYTFDVYNLTNTSSFDVPGNEVAQNAGYNSFPAGLNTSTSAPQQAQPSSCSAAGVASGPSSFYACPAGLGIVTHTIGSPRQVQMSLAFTF